MEFTIALPEFGELWAQFHWKQLLYILYVTIPYGFLTHLKTLPAVHRFNKELVDKNTALGDIYGKRNSRYKLCGPNLFVVLLYRVTLGLPIRIVAGIVGIACIFLSFISTGIPAIRNDALKWAWKWHYDSIDLANEFKPEHSDKIDREKLALRDVW